MKKNKALITFVYHSFVIVETEDHLMVFDAFLEEPHITEHQLASLLAKNETKDVIFFATHGHHDHFTEKIIGIGENRSSKVFYVLSSDLENRVSGLTPQKTSFFLAPGESLKLQGFEIKAFGSTDLGCSYLIMDHGKDLCFFHSGDLNWWHWKSFTKEEQMREKEDYLKEIQLLEKELLERKLFLDFAFVPVDPRLEEFFPLAANAFLDRIPLKKLIPIHFRNHYDITKSFKAQCKNPDQCVVISKSMESFTI